MGPWVLRVPDDLHSVLRSVTWLDSSPADMVTDSVEKVASTAEVARLGSDLRLTLKANRFAIVTGVAPEARYALTGAIAHELGGLTGQPAGALGGETTEVVTSSFFDHNLAWHTDSTSWVVPNRWQVLTLIQPDSLDRLAPTSVLRWSDIVARLSDPSRATLQSHPFGWRDQFVALPPLYLPVLGEAPRWLRPALANYLEVEGIPAGGALRELAHLIANSTPTAEVQLDLCTVLVFDNHAVLHRGPHLEPDGGRTVLRLKLGGEVGSLART